jgi:hypothetical protein
LSFSLLLFFVSCILDAKLNTKAFFVFRWRKHNLEFCNSFSDFRLAARIVNQCDTKLATKIFEHSDCEMTIFVQAICRPLERTFEGETVYQIEFSPHYYTCSRLPSFLYYEVTIGEAKILCISTIQIGEDAFLEAVRFLVRTTIHEDVFLPRVTVEIAKEQNVSAF